MKSKIVDHWSNLAQDIVREIRGNRSQDELNSALNLKFNQVHRWETGRKRILWSEFAKLCEICKIPLKKTCENVLRFYAPLDRGDLFFQIAVSQDDIQTFATRYNISIQVVRRWRLGDSELTLDGALRALEFRMHSIIPFLTNLMDISKFSTLVKKSQKEHAQREVFYSHPAFAMLLTTLHLAEVRNAPQHDIPFLQKYLNIDSYYLRKLIDLGLEHELLKKDGERLTTPNLAFSLRANPERVLDFYHYWTERAINVQKNIDTESIEDFFPTFIVTTNPESRRKIKDAIAALRTTIINATKTDAPIDRMSVIQVSCFTPTELPQPVH